MNASPAQLQWILGGYTLALGTGLITGARLGDIHGRRRMFVVGVAGFTAASALCALAVGPGMLIATRVAQGLFAAAMVPQVLAQIQVMFAPEERGGPMAAFSSLVSLAATLGPILGPLLAEADLWGMGWRLVFWVNVPVGVLTLVASLRLLPESRAPGAALSTAALVLLLYPLIAVSDEAHWPGWATALVVVGALTLGAFALHQRRARARDGTPLVEPTLFRYRSLRDGLLVQLLFFVPVMGFLMVLTQFLQVGVGMGPVEAGLTIAPWAVAVGVGASLGAAVLVPRIGRVTVQAGLALLMGAFLLLTPVAGGATPDLGLLDLLPGVLLGVLLGGAGMGLVVAPIVQLTLADVPTEHAGSGSALFNTVTQIAAAIGGAAIGTYYFSGVRDVLATATGSPEALADGVGGAFRGTLVLCAALLVAALAATFLLPSRAATPEAGAGARARAGAGAEPASPRTPVRAADDARGARAPGA
ncbi:MFS transporter [Streptomyces sp. PT12]|uniref:MFS transporter n=1 Tax=Streptomyces sp. PT12 TaxID=1510197 RepID=UPI000DE4C9C1|nr:MFS transporter [Streptomyces sp. PT12]RBM19720.1 MFS transporter [Streptomyces sp. PT12]